MTVTLSLWIDGGKLKQICYMLGGLLWLLHSTTASASDVDVFGDLQFQARFGRAALADGGARYGTDMTLSPSLEIVRTTARMTSTLNYGLRLLGTWSTPAVKSMILFHQLRGSNLVVLTRRTSWLTSGILNYGDIDFSRSGLIFNQNGTGEEVEEGVLGSTRPQAEVIRSLTFSVSSGVSHRLSLKQRFSTSVTYLNSRQLKVGNSSDDSVFPITHNAGLDVQFVSVVSSKDSLTASVRANYTYFSIGPRYIPINPAVSWTRKLSVNGTLSLRVGSILTFEDQFEPEIVEDNWGITMLPSGAVSVGMRPRLGTRTIWSFGADAGVDTSLEPVRAAVLPRFFCGLNAQNSINSKLGILANIRTGMLLDFGDISQENTTTPYTMTTTVSLSVNWEVLRNTRFSFGILANAANTDPFEGDVVLGRQELMAIVSLAYRFDPNHSSIEE